MSVLSLLSPMQGINMLRQHHELLKSLVKRNLAMRYKGSVLGYFWSFAQPLLMLSVYTFVFGVVFKSRWGIDYGDTVGSFAIIMFCGMACYNIFSESLNTSSMLIVGNSNFVKKVIFPLEILPLAQVLSITIMGLVWFLLVLLGSILILGQISWTLIFLPCTLVPLVFFCLGLSYFVASVGVYLRDLPHLVGIGIQILFFMTPIFYPLQMVPERVRWLLYLNPLTAVVEETRNLFLFNTLPNFWLCFGLFIGSLLVFQLGLAWFLKTKKGFADVL